jgi:branched-chain amino acid transport system substrate-binding protein
MERTASVKSLFLLAAVGLIFSNFFGNIPKVAAAEAKPIKIGVSQDFSGVTAQEGLQEYPAFEMAIKEINDAGGVNGRPIELFKLDNSGDPSKTIGTLKVLKERDECVAVYYGINSVGGIAAKAWADQNHIPIISAAPISDKMIQKEGKAWFFRTEGTNTEVAKAFLLEAKKMGFKKIGLEITTQAFGTDLESVIKRYYRDYGLELVGSVECEPGSKDLTIQATRLKRMGPEVVINQNYPADQVVWARAIKTIGWEPKSMGIALIIQICMGLSPAELYDGWIVTMPYDKTKPSARTVWDKYAAYTGKRLETDLTIRGYDVARILCEAIRLGGNPDNPEAIRDGFYKIKNFPILVGSLDSTCNFEIGRNYVLSAKDYVAGIVKEGEIIKMP